MRYLGIDYGSKKIGLALSDEEGRMGFPHSIIPNTGSVAEEICALMAREDVGAVVMGESKDFAGVDNPIAADARALAEEITLRAGVDVFYEPEALTSAEARRQHDPQDKTRAPKSRADVDDSAAALILTSYLSKHDHA